MIGIDLPKDRVDEEKGPSPLLAILFLMAIPAMTVWRAFVLVKLWGWFVVPLGIVQIGLAHAVGVSLILGMLMQGSRNIDDIKTDKKAMIKAMSIMMFAPPTFWLFGAIIHAFM